MFSEPVSGLIVLLSLSMRMDNLSNIRDVRTHLLVLTTLICVRYSDQVEVLLVEHVIFFLALLTTTLFPLASPCSALFIVQVVFLIYDEAFSDLLGLAMGDVRCM